LRAHFARGVVRQDHHQLVRLAPLAAAQHAHARAFLQEEVDHGHVPDAVVLAQPMHGLGFRLGGAQHAGLGQVLQRGNELVANRLVVLDEECDDCHLVVPLIVPMTGA
jgi:hypothetical protein